MKLSADMGERAALAQFGMLDDPASWSALTDEMKDAWRRSACVALEAALAAPRVTVAYWSETENARFPAVLHLESSERSLCGKRVALVPLDD